MKLSGLFCCLALLCCSTILAQANKAQTLSVPANMQILTAKTNDYTTLLNAVKATDLFDNLRDKGSFTVFAPSDAAFKRLDPQQVQELLKPENKKDLTSVLAYHVVAGELTASRILKAMCRGEGVARLTTVQGEELLASMDGTDIILQDCSGNTARIVSADANAENLTFHQIDSVILPSPL